MMVVDRRYGLIIGLAGIVTVVLVAILDSSRANWFLFFPLILSLIYLLANSIYLEWFSEANGRVVIESSDYAITISAPEWRLTPEEDQQRARQAASGMSGFMQRLSEAVESHQRGQKDPARTAEE